MKDQSIFIQYIIEIALILVLGYAVSFFLPWWTVAIVAGLVTFLYNAKTISFLTGFVAIALLWGRVAHMLSANNDHLLAGKMAGILNPDGAIGAISVVLLTALLGGLIGGLGALTGKLGRQLL